MSTRPRKPGPATPAPGKLALPELLEMKARGEKIVMVTAYDAPGARLADAAGIDLVQKILKRRIEGSGLLEIDGMAAVGNDEKGR